MSKEFVDDFLRNIEGFVGALPSSCAGLVVDRGANSGRLSDEYHVDCEVKITPLNPKSLGITLWLSDCAIGLFLEDFSIVKRLVVGKSSGRNSRMACAGFEPIVNVDICSVLNICQSVSKGEFRLCAGMVFGCLKGVYASMDVKAGHVVHSAVGYPKIAIDFLSKLGVAKLIEAPYEPW